MWLGTPGLPTRPEAPRGHAGVAVGRSAVRRGRGRDGPRGAAVGSQAFAFRVLWGWGTAGVRGRPFPEGSLMPVSAHALRCSGCSGGLCALPHGFLHPHRALLPRLLSRQGWLHGAWGLFLTSCPGPPGAGQQGGKCVPQAARHTGHPLGGQEGPQRPARRSGASQAHPATAPAPGRALAPSKVPVLLQSPPDSLGPKGPTPSTRRSLPSAPCCGCPQSQSWDRASHRKPG